MKPATRALLLALFLGLVLGLLTLPFRHGVRTGPAAGTLPPQPTPPATASSRPSPSPLPTTSVQPTPAAGPAPVTVADIWPRECLAGGSSKPFDAPGLVAAAHGAAVTIATPSGVVKR